MVCDRNGLPISVSISGASTHDGQRLVPLVRGIPPVRSRRGPRRRRPAELHGDKGYDFEHLRRWSRHRKMTPRIAGRGIECLHPLGLRRWMADRRVTRLCECRRLHRRYGRQVEHFLASVGTASGLICYSPMTN
ncbi:hypothetical protein HCJ76_25345 [Streptomyces sp. MC1]|nr:hypothetical protein [Streptomyces sp. MC1]